MDGSISIDVKHLWLSRYISFNDAVRLEDLARAFDAALQREIPKDLAAGRRFACIAHSTGGLSCARGGSGSISIATAAQSAR